MTADFSRVSRLASLAASSDEQSLRQRIESAHVHISADVDLPGATKTLELLVADLRRLPIQLSIDPHAGAGPLPSALLDSLQRSAASIDPDRPLTIRRAPSAAVHVHVGARTPETSRFAGAPDGHGTHVRSAGHAFPRISAPGTGLGAVLTAAMLTGEVFKEVTGLADGARRRLDSLDFCPVTLGPTIAPALSLPTTIPDVALVGAGAIGTAIVTILDALGLGGRITVVDPQSFEPPNVSTYSLGTIADAQSSIPKVALAARHLPGFDVQPFQGTAQQYLNLIDSGTAPWPDVVLGAVDDNDAREELQRVYTDLTLDGSTGGSAGTTLTLQEGRPHGPCIRCYRPRPARGAAPTTEQRLHAVTGLPITRIARGDDPLTEQDLRQLSDDQRRLLEPHIGKPVCGLGQLAGLVPGTDDDFRPSASFVSQQAACLVVGALLGRLAGKITGQMREVQYDALHGPVPGMGIQREPRPTCDCQRDTALIERVRAARRRHG